MKNIDMISFDLGGVLTWQDLDKLTKEELFLFKVYMNRFKINDKELIEYAHSKIPEIYLKIYKLTNDAIPTLEILKDLKIKPSIWTNNIKEIDNFFEEASLYRYIERNNIINSFDIEYDKPNINFYKKALKQIKKNPHDILFFDDSIINVIAARKLDIHSIHFNNQDNLDMLVEKEIKRKR